jgi:glycosyltransferase involved in cell wall biosynthesis
MKIVHVEDFFHPDAGYQLNLLAPLQVAEGHEVTVVTAEMDKVPSFLTTFFGRDDIPEKDRRFERETGVRIVRLPLLAFYSGRAIFSPRRLVKTVSELKPEVAYIHGEDTLTGMLFIWLSKWLKYPLVLDCHMLEMASLNRFRLQFRAFYQRFVTPIILRENIPLIRVQDSNYVEKCLGIPLQHTDLLSFGTDTSTFKPDQEVRRAMRDKHGIAQNAFVVLYAGKLDETKGGRLLADAVRNKLQADPGRPIHLMVVGNADGPYGVEVDRILASSENPLVRLSTQRYPDLPGIYQTADVSVFPKQCSLSFFEAQSCGLPVLFEDNEINRQRAVNGNAILFEPDSVEDLRSKLLHLAGMSAADYDVIRANARRSVLEAYDYVPIARRFTAVCQRAIEQRQCKLQAARQRAARS